MHSTTAKEPVSSFAIDRFMFANMFVKCSLCVRFDETLEQRQDAEREISILQQLNNENVCKLECAYKNGKHMVLIMEYCNGGELFNKICAESEACFLSPYVNCRA